MACAWRQAGTVERLIESRPLDLPIAGAVTGKGIRLIVAVPDHQVARSGDVSLPPGRECRADIARVRGNQTVTVCFTRTCFSGPRVARADPWAVILLGNEMNEAAGSYLLPDKTIGKFMKRVSHRRARRSSPLFTVLRLAGVCLAGAVLSSLPLGTSGHLVVGAQAPDPCAPPNGNPIVCENQLPGAPESEWDIIWRGRARAFRASRRTSASTGGRPSASRSTRTPRTIASTSTAWATTAAWARARSRRSNPSAALPQNQPNCLTRSPRPGLIDCGNWAVSASWAVPADAVSGIYFAKAIRTDTGGASHIVFIVRDDAGNSDLLFQTSDTTWQAYNQYGGNSLYVGGRRPAAPTRSATTVRSRRASTAPEDWVFNAEYPMVRWLEANGYNVSYFTGVDTDRIGAEIREHKIFLSVGHDEYWSARSARTSKRRAAPACTWRFSAATRCSGRRAGRTASRRRRRRIARWSPTRRRTPTPRSIPIRRLDRHLARSPLQPAGRRRPARERADRHDLHGQLGHDGDPGAGRRRQDALLAQHLDRQPGAGRVGHAAERHARLRVGRGSRQRLPARRAHPAVGYDRQPAWSSSRTTARLTRQGTANHALTLYRHASGALVFGAGTVQWSWGLDSNHDRGSAAAERRRCSRRRSICSPTWACSR